MTIWASIRRMAGYVGLMALLLAACAGDGQPVTEPSPGPTARDTDVGPLRLWLAVFATDRGPDVFEEETQDLLDKVDDAIRVGSIGCFEGLADELDVPPDSTILGVAGETEEQMAAAVEKSEREPIFTGEVLDMCSE